MKNTKAFTMIELVFVIVVLGILAAVAIPRFSATRDDAKIAAGRATIAAVRSGIVSERQTRLLRGQNNYVATLDDDFANILSYEPGSGWTTVTAGTVFKYTFGSSSATFTYTPSDGKFLCTSGDCAKLGE
ncbi:MAG: hypothetical protein B5M52_00180 [Helicobacteraceae bacterium 4484_230]|nr:MAG: hypothetical protein B5M52_00180 [Helicobacteraceae bacterium 4484_230]